MSKLFEMNEIGWEIIKLVISLVSTVIVAFVIRYIWKNLLFKIAKKTPTDLDILIIEQTTYPVYFFIVAIGFYTFFNNFALASGTMDNIFVKGLSEILYIFLIFSISFITYAVIKTFCDWYLREIAHKTESQFDDQFIPLFSKLIKIIIFFIATTIILSHLKVNISGFIATAGVASLAVAFAAQETLANLISGFMIMIDKPFRPGDRIEIDSGLMGDVYEIGLRTTKILSFDNNLLIIPNNEIAKSRITNHSYPDVKVKIRQTIGVSYGSDLYKVKQSIIDICSSHPEVLKNPPPGVYFANFGESMLDLLMICWVNDYKEKFRITDELNMEIKKKFEEQGIEIPFPQRDIHIKT